MNRRNTTLIGSALLHACNGGGKGGEEDSEIPLILSTVAGEYPVQGDVVRNTCGNDFEDLLDNLIIKLDQVPTGLSLFVDPDVGWIPCDGSVQSFECRWGNAPSDDIVSVWNWSLVGTTDGEDIDATLGLVVTCDGGGGGDCEPCQIVADYTGKLGG